MCCISLLPDYFKLKKYNIYELAQPEKPEETPDSAAKPNEEVAEEPAMVEEKSAAEKPSEEPSAGENLTE